MTTDWATRLRSPRTGQLLFDRFEVLEELGFGGFGRVLRCSDRDNGEEVALKELHRVEADSLLRFKEEFRALSDVRHPNLVRLGELVEDSGHWAFTLEYVPGTDALSWVRAGNNDPGFSEARLRDMLVQLVHALTAVHQLGMVHRDVKPQNVRVTPEGRVVLLDFGLVGHLHENRQSDEFEATGTAEYMAPEQASAERAGPEADWYGVGVLLYEALSGRLPFDGTPAEILMRKQRRLPPAPSTHAPGIPADLDALCMGLLAIDPGTRLTGEAVLALVSEVWGAQLSHTSNDARESDFFVGRRAEITKLNARFDAAMTHGFSLVLIEGESGIGKTTLVQHFSSLLRRDRADALVLEGRCHVAEQLAYKAFDGVVDELSRYLTACGDPECRAVLPRDEHLLPALFPVLGRVPRIAAARPSTPAERIERYPLFTAFVELLERLSRTRRIVLVVDDLQWADEASLVLLRVLLESPRAPHLLLVATVRPLDSLDGAIGEGLRSLAQHEGVSRVSLAGLGMEETRQLTSHLTGAPEDARIVTLLAKESHGHPLFVTELSRHLDSAHAAGGVLANLDATLLSRVSALDDAARTALEVLSVAGAPLSNALLRAAISDTTDSVDDVLGTLRAQKLVRPVRRNETVVYHDRIRQAVLDALDFRTRASHHRRLAFAWRSQPSPDAARVALHWIGCGEHLQALPWLEQAAETAARLGAFEQAAEHFQTLSQLEGVTHTREVAHQLELSRSDALANAGRCAESARVLLAALKTASEGEAPELSIRAAQRLLQAGQVEEGLAAAQKAFELLELPWPKTSTRALLRMLWNRLWVNLSRADSTDAESPPVSERSRAELEALQRLVVPTGWADLLRSAELGSRHARLALRTRDPTHLAYALFAEASFRAMQSADPMGNPGAFDQATAWRARVGTPELEAFEALNRGSAAVFAGNQREAEAHLTAAERMYRLNCPGAQWELANVRGALLMSWYARGRFRHHAENAQTWIEEASLRGDKFAQATYAVAGVGCNRHLMADAPDRALDELSTMMAPWRTKTVGIQQFMEGIAGGWVLGYEGGASADAYWAARWPALEGSFLFRMHFMREGLYAMRTLTALAQAGMRRSDSKPLLEAGAVLEKLRGARTAWGRGTCAFFGAQLAWLSGNRASAAMLARDARARCEGMGMFYTRFAALLEARADRHESADQSEAELLDWLAQEGFSDPEKAMFCWLPAARTWR